MITGASKEHQEKGFIMSQACTHLMQDVGKVN